MNKVPTSRYTKEFREEAVKLVVEGGFTAYEASRRLNLPKSTLENWLHATKKVSRISRARCIFATWLLAIYLGHDDQEKCVFGEWMEYWKETEHQRTASGRYNLTRCT